jgi:hypothetical protein
VDLDFIPESSRVRHREVRHNEEDMMKFVTTLLLLVLAPFACQASTITYDASSGNAPESVGWSYTPDTATRSVAGGILTFNSDVASRAGWSFDMGSAGFSSATGVFESSTVKIDSETHTSSTRGLHVLELDAGDGAQEVDIDVFAQADQVFPIMNGTRLGTVMLDTTDAFHTYRLDLTGDNYSFLVDGTVRLTGTVVPSSDGDPPFLEAEFGDQSGSAGSQSEWTNVTIGSIEATPEPASVLLLGSGGLGLMTVGVRKRLQRKPARSA